MHRTLSAIGIVLTLGYVAGVMWLFGWELDQIKSMKPNEVGDFLTGVFGPLAILWLILGYFQQGIELRLNTEALKLQAEELKNSASEQRELVSTTRAQLKAEREHLELRRQEFERTLLPSFVFTGLGSSTKMQGIVYQVHVRNLGAMASDVHFIAPDILSFLSQPDISVFMPAQEYMVEFQFQQSHPNLNDRLQVSFLDAAGRAGKLDFAFALNEHGTFCNIVRREG